MTRAPRLRVLFLFTPTGFGADTHIHLLILRELVALGVEVHAAVAAPEDGGSPGWHDELRSLLADRMRLVSFGASLYGRSRMEKLATLPRYGRSVWGLAALAVSMRRLGVQVVHSTDRPRDAIACVVLARLIGARSVIHVHVKYGDWMSRGVRWALGRADAVVGVSEFVAASLIGGGYRRDRVHAVLNAIELHKWAPTFSRDAGRNQLGLGPDTPLILCVARIFPAKGQDVLVRALPRLAAELEGVRVVLVGADYPPGGSYSNELRALAAELGVSEHLLFTGQRSDVDQLMAASDVFCLPSSEEPFGLVFAEAMAMELPVVAIADGGTVEVVEHGQTGLLVPAQDPQALAEALIQLLRDPQLRARFGAAGRRRVLKQFGAERMARDVERVYVRLLY